MTAWRILVSLSSKMLPDSSSGFIWQLCVLFILILAGVICVCQNLVGVQYKSVNPVNHNK